MKKIVLLIVLVLSAWFALAQQAPSDSLLMRKHGHLQFAGANEKLNDAEVQSLLISSDFTKYKQARREHIASIPLWVLTGVSIVPTMYYFIGYISSKIFHIGHPILLGCFSAGFFGITLCLLAPSLSLTLDGRTKMNRIVSNYNQQQSSVSFNFGLTRSGVGLTLNF